MKRSFVVAIALSLAPAALANGAMYHGFERFHFWPWVADCAVMVALEAWLLGRALGFNWRQAVTRSLGANALTALVVPSVFAPAFHPMTTELDARPLLDESLFLAGVTLASALIEASVWVGSVKSGAAALGKTALLSLAVLGALLPIGLALFLLPERPTRLMEAQVAANRRLALSDLVRKVSVPQWPRAQTTGQFVTALGGVSATDSSLLSYVPEYRRFDTREMRRQPVEFNRDLDGTPVRFEGNVRWVFRFRDSDGKTREVTEDGDSGGRARLRASESRAALSVWRGPHVLSPPCGNRLR